MKVELREIRKRFGSVQALCGVDLVVSPGRITGILGENGAGKSTLMKVLAGVHRPDSGQISVDGEPVSVWTAERSAELGIGMLYQDPLDFGALSVLDNFAYGRGRGLFASRRKARRELLEGASELGFSLDPGAAVSSLSVGERAQLEIVRLLSRGVRLLILDEPTTAISDDQRRRLFSALRELAGRGLAVLFVSHKLAEVEELCSEVTVLARGRVSGEAALPCPRDRLIHLMFGRGLPPSRERTRPARGDIALELCGVSASGGNGELKDASLEVRAGEIVGLAGVEGSGQRLLFRICAGLSRPERGTVAVRGREMTGRPYRDFCAAGVAYIPAARLEEGLVRGLTLCEHMALSCLPPRLAIDWAAASRLADERIVQFGIKGTAASRVEELSGGNQQRALLSLLPYRLDVLLVEHPTRGLDLESAEHVFGLLAARASAGTAILLSSSDLDELREHTDRVHVLFAGRLSGPLESPATSAEQIGALMGGQGFA